MMEKICGIYKIINTITGDFYIGSSKDVKRRWESHKWSSTWKQHPNNPLYQDMQKYGVDKFEMQILAVVEPEQLKEIEQKFIDTLKPTYNNINAKDWNVARYKEYNKEYNKERNKSDKCKQYHKEYNKEYNNQLCFYNGEVLTLCALQTRFSRAGIPHPTQEAKKYLV